MAPPGPEVLQPWTSSAGRRTEEFPPPIRAPALLCPFEWGGLFTVLSDRRWSRSGLARVVTRRVCGDRVGTPSDPS